MERTRKSPVDDGMEKWLVSLMLQGEVVRDFANGRIAKEDFQNLHYGSLYQALCDLPKGTVWEVPVLADRLGYDKDSDATHELTELRNYSFGGSFDCKKSPQVVTDAVNQVLTMAKKRFIHRACTDLADLADNPTTDLLTIEAALTEMQKKIATGETRKSWAQHTMDWVDLLQYRFAHQSDRETLGTGMPSIDSIIGRFDCGHLIVIKARYKVGKSAFVLGIVNHATVDNKVPGLILSLEMSRVEWHDRLFSHRSGVDGSRIILGRLREGDFPKIVAQVVPIRDAPLYCEDVDCNLLGQILSLLRFYKITAGIQYAIVDHGNLVQFPGSKLQPHENLGVLTGALKNAAKQLAMTIFCIFQTNTDGTVFGSKTAVPANLDKDIHITTPKGKKPSETNERNVDVELNRHGRTGGVKAIFDGATMTFKEITTEGKNGYVPYNDT